MELRCQLERHTAALYADRAPVITNRRADAVLSFYLARARLCFIREKGKFGKFWEEISGIVDKDVCSKILAKFQTKCIPYLIDAQG